mgnify:FL=1
MVDSSVLVIFGIIAASATDIKEILRFDLK